MKWSKLRAWSFHHGKREDLTSLGTLKIDIFEVFGYVNLGGEKIIADLDASRRDLVKSIFKKFVATLQAKILAIK